MKRQNLLLQTTLNVIMIVAVLLGLFSPKSVRPAYAWPETAPTVPARSSGIPGTQTSQLTPGEPSFVGPVMPAQSAQALPFEDDFESGLGSWRVYAGEARIDVDDNQPAGYGRHVLSLWSADTGLLIRRGTTGLQNYVVTALIKQVGEDDLDGVILVRAEDGPNARAASYKLEHDTDYGFHLDKRDNTRMLTNRGDSPKTGVWEWQKVYVAGNVIKARYWLDGEPEPAAWQLEVEDGERIAGSIGLSVYSARVQIAYVRVEAVEGTPAAVGSYSEADSSRNDSGWGPGQRVGGAQGEVRRSPAVAADASGRAYAVWQAPGNGVASIYFAEGLGKEWSPEVRLDDGRAWRAFPAVTVDSAGNVYVVWEDEREGSADVYFTWRPAGAKTWGANEQVNDDQAGYQGQPAIAADQAGNVYVVWKDERKDQSAISFAWRPAGAQRWHSSEQIVVGKGTTSLGQPAIAADGAGNVYVAWEDSRQADNSDIFLASRAADTGKWSAALRLNDDGGSAYQGQPSLAADQAGNVYAAWEDGRQGGQVHPDVYFTRQQAGTKGWSANTRANDDGSSVAHLYPAVAAGPGGTVHIVWEDYRDGHWQAPDIYAATWSPDTGSWSANEQVNDDEGTVYHGEPAVAAAGTGRVYTLWEDTSNWGMYYPEICLAEEECPLVNCDQFQDFIAGPVNTFSGNYHYRHTDLEMPTAGPALLFERSYNSRAFDLKSALGYGWTFNYGMQVAISSEMVEITAPHGSILYFKVEDQSYQPLPGIRAALEKTGDYTYTLTAFDQQTYVLYADPGSGVTHLIQYRDAQGNVLDFHYENGKLSRVEEPVSGRYLDFTYNGDQLIEVQDPINRTVGFGYNSSGDLTVVTDTMGLVWTYSYTSYHLLTEVMDPADNTIEGNEYDDYMVARQWNEAGEWQFDYERPYALSWGGTVTITNPLNQTTVDYYGNGESLEEIVTLARQNVDAQGHGPSYAYDAQHLNRTLITNTLGFATAYAYGTACGCHPTVITDSLGNTTTMTYDGYNHLTSRTDALGRTTNYEYDGNNLVLVTDPLSGTTEYTYNALGQVTSVTDANDHTIGYGYDELGQRVVLTDAMGTVTRYGYDLVGRLVTTTVAADTPLARVTVNEYDNADRIIATTENYLAGPEPGYLDEYNLITTYDYDRAGRLITTTVATGTSLRRVTVNDYDPAGRLVKATENYLDDQVQNYLDEYNLVTRYAYDALGNQTRITDTLGIVTVYEYDAERDWLNRQVVNYVDGVYDPDKPDEDIVTEYDYDMMGNQVWLTDTLGSATKFEYDPLDRMEQQIVNYENGAYDPDHPDQDLVTTYSYDDVGNQYRVTDPAGIGNRSEYDELDRVKQQVANYVDGTYDPNHPDEDVTSQYNYDAVGNQTVVTDTLGRETSYEYDPLNRTITVTDALQDRTVYGYDRLSNRVRATDAEGCVTEYGYDSLGRQAIITSTVDGQPYTTTYEYDLLGNRFRTTDAEGNSTHYGYDSLGRQTVITDALTFTTTYAYNAAGNRTRVTDAEGHTTRYGYDDLNRMVIITNTVDTEEITTRYVYDGLGKRTAIIDPLLHRTDYVYDDLGRVITITDPLDNSMGYAYDAVGNRTSATDAEGVATCYGYDELNRLASVAENCVTGGPSTSITNVLTVYTYDGLGNRLQVIDARGYTTTYTYDDLHRLLSAGDPLSNVTQYGYDRLGNRTVMTDANEAVTTYDYDELNRLTVIHYPDAEVEYGYNKVGLRTAMTDTTGTATYEYDDAYRLLTVTDGRDQIIGYGYDTVGNRTVITYPGGLTVTYGYDDLNRMKTVTDWDGSVTRYTYDDAGRLIGVSRPNGVDTTFSYDDASRLLALEHVADGQLLARYTYVLDKVGNRLAVTETLLYPAQGSAALPAGLMRADEAPLDAEGVARASLSPGTPLSGGTAPGDTGQLSTRVAAQSPNENGPVAVALLLSGIYDTGAGPWTRMDRPTALPTPTPSLTATITATIVSPAPAITATRLLTQTPTEQPASPLAPVEPGHAASIVVRLERTSLPADGKSQMLLVALVLDERGNQVPDGTLVQLRAAGGRVSPVETQTTGGLVLARFQAGTESGTGYVEIHAGGAAARAQLTLAPLPAGQARLDDGSPPPDAPLPFDMQAVVEQARNQIQIPDRGLPFVERDGHRATFDAGSLRFLPLGGRDIPAPLTTTVQLAGVYVGEQPLFEGPAPAVPDVRSNAVRFERGRGLVEEYLARDDGIEERLRIEQDLGLAGDLVMSVEVETALDLALAEGGEGVVFRWTGPGGERMAPVVSYGRALALDADGRAKRAGLRAEEVEASQPGLRRYRLEMRFPAEWLGEARYPIVIDPLVGGLLRLDAALTQPGTQSKPAVAYNSTAHQYLAVWQDNRDGSYDVYGQLVRADGLLAGENFTITAASGSQTVPDVAYNSDDDTYLVVWLGSAGTTVSVDGQVVSAAGELSGTVLTLYSSTLAPPDRPAVTYSAAAQSWLVAWQQWVTGSSDVWARAVDGGGGLDTAFAVFSDRDDDTLPDVAANDGGGFLVVWEREEDDSRRVYAQRTGTNKVEGDAFRVDDESAGLAPRLVYNQDDDQYLVTWQETGSEYDIIRSRRVWGHDNPGGQLISETFEVSEKSEVDCGAPAVTYFAPSAANSGRYLVAWEEQGKEEIDLQARWVLTDGTPTGTLTLSDADGSPEDAALGFGPAITETLAAWTDGRAGNLDVYARRIEPDGDMDGEFIVHPAPGDQQLPQVVYNPDDDEYLVVWQDYRHGANNSDVYAQRVSGGGLLTGENITVTAAAYHQVGPRVAYATAGQAYLVVWRHYLGTSSTYYDVYGQIISHTGELEGSPLAIANDSGPYDQESPSDVVYNPTSDQFLVLWHDRHTGFWEVQGRHVSPTGALGSEIQITSGNNNQEESATGAYNPDDDQYLIAWEYRASSGALPDVHARRVTGSGVVTTTDTIFVATGSSSQDVPDVAYLAEAGRYVVVWESTQYLGTNGFDLYEQLVAPDGALDGSNTIVAAGTRSERYPRLTLDDAGGALVVWGQGTGSGTDLHGRWLGSDGRPAGERFVLLEADGNQDRPVAVGDGAGSYLLAWQDDRNGNWDIYGSLFEPLQAGFAAAPTLGAAPLEVAFSDQSTPAGAADEWQWAFGDGGTSTAQHPVYTYTQAGVYTVTQWVTDTAAGETDVLTRIRYITVTRPVTIVISYDYDPLYRLIAATYSTGEVYTYTYDPVGNRLAMGIDGQVITYTYDQANRLTQVGSVGYIWDDNGNLLEDGVRSYEYDHANRLVAVVSGALTTTFAYNGDGHRVAQATNGVTTTYVVAVLGLSQVLVETTGGETTCYVFSHDLLAEHDGVAWAYHLDDGLGSVRQLADEDGQVTLAQGYAPFGEPLWNDGSGTTGFGFTGERWEAYTGLVFLRARYYEPEMGRFVNRDPWPDHQLHPVTLNAFVYASNNPTNRVDESGLLSGSPIEAMIQVKYVEDHAAFYFAIVPEYYIPVGSKQGLNLDTSGEAPLLTGTPTGFEGRADLVGLGFGSHGDLYEIKNKRDITRAIAEVSWYIEANNTFRQQTGSQDWPILVPGQLYTWAPAEDIIGTNPFYSGQWIVANMPVPGVISWRGKPKPDNGPWPKYVWEWDPVKRKVEKRELVAVGVYAACMNSEFVPLLGKRAGEVVVIGGTAYIVWKVLKAAAGFVIAGPPGAFFGLATP